MHASHVTEQTWGFECRHCGHRWTVDYEAHHAECTAGMDYCVWTQRGMPSTAPASGAPCPRCTSLDVAGGQSAPEVWHE